jgi:hypothetical protein
MLVPNSVLQYVAHIFIKYICKSFGMTFSARCADRIPKAAVIKYYSIFLMPHKNKLDA